MKKPNKSFTQWLFAWHAALLTGPFNAPRFWLLAKMIKEDRKRCDVLKNTIYFQRQEQRYLVCSKNWGLRQNPLNLHSLLYRKLHLLQLLQLKNLSILSAKNHTRTNHAGVVSLELHRWCEVLEVGKSRKTAVGLSYDYLFWDLTKNK